MSLDIPHENTLALEILVNRLTELEKENLSLKMELAHLELQVDANAQNRVKKTGGWALW